MSEKVRSGERRQAGWLYFVKGDNLEVWKARMARGGKKKSRSSSKKSKARRR